MLFEFMKNHWFQFFEKNKNQRIISPGYFSDLKKAKVFMQELLVLGLVI
jgi:hypothetical protein